MGGSAWEHVVGGQEEEGRRQNLKAAIEWEEEEEEETRGGIGGFTDHTLPCKLTYQKPVS